MDGGSTNEMAGDGAKNPDRPDGECESHGAAPSSGASQSMPGSAVEIARATGPVTATARLGRIATCVPLLLLVIIVLLEIWLRQGNPVDALNFRNVDAWDVPGRLAISRRILPQVALVGSSLMLVLNQDERGDHVLSGYDPAYLRGLLDKATGKQITCINLATGVQMVSESYFMTEAICNARPYPSVIIYGTAMRDFVHEALAREWVTESFNSIAPFAPFSAVFNVYSPDSLKEFVLSHFFYLYRNRTDFKILFSAKVKLILEDLPWHLDSFYPRLNSDCVWRQGKSGLLLEEIIPRKEEKVFEKLRLEHPDRLVNYFKRVQSYSYASTSPNTAQLSQHYFKCLQELCKRKNIILVVVNMPLAPDVCTVVPSAPMEVFRQYLRRGGEAGDYKLIDLWADSRFLDSDYRDGVHFNLSGAQKFAQIVVQQLQTKFPEVLSQMASQASGR